MRDAEEQKMRLRYFVLYRASGVRHSSMILTVCEAPVRVPRPSAFVVFAAAWVTTTEVPATVSAVVRGVVKGFAATL